MPIGGGGGSQPAILLATKTLTSAQILALNSTPVTLVAGVAGKVVVPIIYFGSMAPGGTAYTFSDAFRVFNGAAFSSSGFGSLTTSSLLPLTVSVPTQSVQLTPYQDSGEASSLNAGQPLRMDTTGAATLGDGTGTVAVLYALVPSA